MTIEELIAELEEIKKDHGNIEVKVQYRDVDGYYYGYDDDLEQAFDELGLKDPTNNSISG